LASRSGSLTPPAATATSCSAAIAAGCSSGPIVRFPDVVPTPLPRVYYIT
jgi:hypothetical protein